MSPTPPPAPKRVPFWNANLPATFRKDGRVHWHRSKVDPKLMSELMRCSDWQGLRQAAGHLGLWFATGTLAFLAFRQVKAANWCWSAPLLLAALFAHGTVGNFMGGAACHELSHKTPFKTKALNEFFLRVFAFFGWFDRVWYRPSHIRHHQLTVHRDYDGEVVLPQRFSFRDWQFWLGLFAWNPMGTWGAIRTQWRRATGRLDNSWFEFVLPEEDLALRRQHRNWARFVLGGHLALAATFIATGHGFLVFVFNLGTQYCGWLGFLCGSPQHYGLSPDVPDHRLCCRSYTCSWLPGFLYWNMQYHVEHHMFPAVPFFNLPRLHAAIAHDLPPAPHGLWATWKQILAIHQRQRDEPGYAHVPPLPAGAGERADDRTLRREATLATA